MKKNMSFMLCALALTTIGASQVLAADRVSDTKGDITFTEGGGPGTVETLDPNPDTSPSKNPDPNPEPVKDGDAGSGALKFTYLPNLHFGTSELNAQSVSYYYAEFMERNHGEQATVADYPSFLTVQDVRGGVQGWKVTVSHDGKFVNKADSTDELKARIQLNNANIHTNTFTDAGDIAKYMPASKVTGKDNNYLTISSDTAQEVELMVAEKGTGYGKWSQGFGATNNVTTGKGANGTGDTGTVNPTKANRNLGVRLEFPAQVTQTDPTKNTYEATIVWGLNNTP